jgi:hypothetical protein
MKQKSLINKKARGMRETQNNRTQASTTRALAAIVAAYFLLGVGIAHAQQDVPVVENGFRGSMRNGPTLVENAVAGLDGPEESLLFLPTNLIIDTEGNLYIADAGQHAILVFDRDGKFIRAIGREGDGPGEFRMPAVSYFSWNGELVVEDPGNGRRSFLSMDGEFLRSENMGPVFMSGSPIQTVKGEYVRPGQGAVIMRMSAGGADEEPEPPGLIEVIDGEGNIKLKIGTQKEHEDQMIGMLINRVTMDYAPPNHVVACFQNANEIHVYNKSTGELERIITRRLAFNPKDPDMNIVTERTTDPVGGVRVGARLRPDVDPIADDVAVDREGRIWVLTHLMTSDESGEKEAEGDFEGLMRLEVFSMEGELLSTIPLDIAPSMITFDPFGDMWLVDTRGTLSAIRYQVVWP